MNYEDFTSDITDIPIGIKFVLKDWIFSHDKIEFLDENLKFTKEIPSFLSHCERKNLVVKYVLVSTQKTRVDTKFFNKIKIFLNKSFESTLFCMINHSSVDDDSITSDRFSDFFINWDSKDIPSSFSENVDFLFYFVPINFQILFSTPKDRKKLKDYLKSKYGKNLNKVLFCFV